VQIKGEYKVVMDDCFWKWLQDWVVEKQNNFP